MLASKLLILLTLAFSGTATHKSYSFVIIRVLGNVNKDILLGIAKNLKCNKLQFLVNPLSPKIDQHQISPCNISAL